MIANIAKALFVALILAAACLPAGAQQPASVSVSVKNHRFQPPQIQAPAKMPIELRQAAYA